LQTSEDGPGIVGVEKLEGEVHKSRPSAREIALQDALEDGNKLQANERLGGSQDRDQAVPDAGLLIFGYSSVAGLAVGVEPGTVYAVLDVDNGC
jgi:hypothetical protein